MNLIIEPGNRPRRYAVSGQAGIGSPTYLLTEEQYLAINQWCIDTLGYHARSAHDVFDFRSDAAVALFILRWQ